MGDLYAFDQADRELAQVNNALRQEIEALKHGGGDGTSGGMEARVAVLEAHVEHIRADLAKLSGLPGELASLRGDVSTMGAKFGGDVSALATKVDALPTKDWIATRLQIYVGIMAAISAIAVAATKLL